MCFCLELSAENRLIILFFGFYAVKYQAKGPSHTSIVFHGKMQYSMTKHKIPFKLFYYRTGKTNALIIAAYVPLLLRV